MTNDEVERLARELRPKILEGDWVERNRKNLTKLCDHILSGDMRREIENAAYGKALNRICASDVSCVSEAENAIRALMQPTKTPETEG